MNFRENLVHLRMVNNMTQEQLAMLLGVSRQSVTKWESGKSSPEMEKLLALCKIFGCTLDELVQGDLSGREATATVVPMASAEPTDVFGYDEESRSFGAKVSNGVMTILLGIAVSLVFFGVADGYEGDYLQNVYCAVALVCLFGGIGGGLSLIIPASLRYSAFVKAHPFLVDFYTPEQKEQARSSFTRQLIGGICCIFASICLVVVLGDTRWGLLLGVPLFFALIAVGVRFIIRGGMDLGRVNLEVYNQNAGEFMEPVDIANSNLPPDKKEELLASYRAEKRTGAVCGAIMVIATIAGLTMLFVPAYQTDYFWLAWVFGGLLCAVVSLLIKGFSRV